MSTQLFKQHFPPAPFAGVHCAPIRRVRPNRLSLRPATIMDNRRHEMRNKNLADADPNSPHYARVTGMFKPKSVSALVTLLDSGTFCPQPVHHKISNTTDRIAPAFGPNEQYMRLIDGDKSVDGRTRLLTENVFLLKRTTLRHSNIEKSSRIHEISNKLASIISK